MKHVLCVHLHQLPIDRLRRREPALRHKPFVLIQTIGSRQVVVHATPAELPDVHPGMSLAEARGRYLGLPYFPATPGEDARTLEALGRWLIRFSPNVALIAPSSIFIDAQGIERLFDGVENFRNRVAQAVHSLGFLAGVAVAPTPAAAWALAAFGKNNTRIVTQENLIASIAPLPIAAMRFEARTLDLLASLGIRTIEQVLRIARRDLAVRFGSDVLLRIDQMLGSAAEPLVFLEHRSPILADIEFDGTVESLEVIQLAVKQLIGQVVELLTTRGLGARELRLLFQCPYAPSIEKTIRLSRPSRNEPAIFNLLRCALETIALDDGVTAIRLRATVTQRLGDEQSQLLGGQEQQNARELDHLVERLRTRLNGGVNWVELTESHIPERSFRYRDEATATAMLPSPVHARIGEFRPLQLLRCPRQIRVIVTPSESREGKPVSFTDLGIVHRLQHVRGPERLSGEWWTGQFKTRDYFDALDAAGDRFWIFRVPQTGRWYVHGKFE